jgi:hypothetical protein
MKKLFKAGLAVFSMAMLATSASAFSPVWSTLPDVLVGGCEGGLNFTNAFNVFDYLTDQDNTSPQLSVVFAEGPWDTNAVRSAQQVDGNTSNDLSINSEAEADYSGSGDIPVHVSSVPAGGGDVSADAGNLTFSTATDGIDRAVVLIASDGFTSASVSKVFRVRSDQAACDDVSFPVSVVTIDQWDAQADFNADWAFGTFLISGTAATSGATGDALIVNAPLAGQNVSFWQTSGGAIPAPGAGVIIRTRYTLSSDAAPTAWPSVQMRLFENDNHNPAELVVSANAYVPAANTSRTYQLFYESPADLTAGLNVALFVIDTNNTQGGLFRLETVVVDAIVGLDNLFTEEQVIDAGESITFSALNFVSFGGAFSNSGTADAYTITANTITGTNFGVAIGQIPNVVTASASNTLYRIINTVTSTQPVATQVGWGFRLFESGNLISNVNRVTGTGANSDVLATTTPKTFSTYLTSEGISGNNLNAAFDVLHNNVNRSGAVTWERAVIESVDLGQIP